jgi:DnaJ-class molecular chaperone
MELKDYYFILGVPRTATARDILRAFRELAKLYHPDRAGSQGTAAFQDIVEAYAILSDPARRRHYNQSLSTYVEVPLPPPPGGSAWPRPEPLIPEQRQYHLHSHPEPLVPEPMALLDDFGTVSPSVAALRDRFLQNFLNRGRSKAERVERLTVEVQLSPYEALHGTLVPVSLPLFVRCPGCGGSGRAGFAPCLVCQGQGLVETAGTVRLQLPPRVREGTSVEVPLHSIGMHNLFLHLLIRISNMNVIR